MKRRELKAEIVQREFDGAWQIITPASMVRLGETDRELVKQGEAVDLTRWVAVHVTNSQRQAKKWLDSNTGYVLRLSTPYEVA
jgi:hypothetical protein